MSYLITLSVTSTAAAALGLADRGGLAPGRRADLIVVEGKPLQGLSCLERVRAVMAEVRRYRERSGRPVMVAFNITDDLDAMRRHAELVERVQLGLLRPPVEAVAPVLDEAAHVREVGAVLPVGVRDLVGPAGERQPRATVG